MSEELFNLMRSFSSALSAAWTSDEFSYSAKQHTRVQGALGPESSLVKCLKAHPWLPTRNPRAASGRSDLLLMPPSALFLRTKEVTELLGNRSEGAFFSDSSLSPAFSHMVGVRGRVDAAGMLPFTL